MKNDYECPRCHNIFPSGNKMLHDAKCTEKNPVPLNESRLGAINKQDNNNKNDDFQTLYLFFRIFLYEVSKYNKYFL